MTWHNHKVKTKRTQTQVCLVPTRILLCFVCPLYTFPFILFDIERAEGVSFTRAVWTMLNQPHGLHTQLFGCGPLSIFPHFFDMPLSTVLGARFASVLCSSWKMPIFYLQMLCTCGVWWWGRVNITTFNNHIQGTGFTSAEQHEKRRGKDKKTCWTKQNMKRR